MCTQTISEESVTFMYEHAGYAYDPRTETAEEGRRRCARELAEAEAGLRSDADVFVVWDYDDMRGDDETLYCALLCVDANGKPDLVRGYDPRDGIFERPGRVVGSLGGIDLASSRDPYRRVVEAELYGEFQSARESAITRGDN